MKRTAAYLERFFAVLQVVYTVAAVASIVGLVLIGACFLFRLNPDQIGTGYQMLDLGFLELELAQQWAPDKHVVLYIVAAELAAAVALGFLGRYGTGCKRRLLKPMKEGMPFHSEAVKQTRRLAILSLVTGVVLNVSEWINHLLTSRFYQLSDLLMSDRITGVVFHFKWDLDFLIIGAVLLLLSYIFSYGGELQQLSDETL